MFLINGLELDAIPAGLARVKASAHARQIKLSTWLIRNKTDGRYLATVDAHGNLKPLTSLAGAKVRRIESFSRRLSSKSPAEGTLALSLLQSRLHELDMDVDSYALATGLRLVPEPARLSCAGRDRYRRPLWLQASASRAWHNLKNAALAEGVRIDAISGFRSHDYQLGIVARKLARGLSLQEILTVNAAPGFSEHHSGRAIDIGCPGEPAAEESFDQTAAFDWLRRRANDFGFNMSYPRDNPHGIVYEPWHWYFAG